MGKKHIHIYVGSQYCSQQHFPYHNHCLNHCYRYRSNCHCHCHFHYTPHKKHCKKRHNTCYKNHQYKNKGYACPYFVEDDDE